MRYDLENRAVTALENLSLEIPLERYTLGVVGESGSGKTTLGMSIMGAIEEPGRITEGSIMFGGTDILKLPKSELRKYQWEKVAMIYQSAMNSLNPVKSVRQPIVEVLRVHRGLSKKEAQEIALKLLSEVGIKEERTGDYPHEFSGGMRQRVVIALALALSPRLLIADEPTSALDVVTQAQILALLKRKTVDSGLSLVFITHEISVLNGLVENIAVMFGGEIVERGTISQVFDQPLHPYTEMLLSTLLTPETGLSAQTTTAADREKGFQESAAVDSNMCKYVFRCKYAFDRCRKERPILREAKKGRWVSCHKWD